MAWRWPASFLGQLGGAGWPASYLFLGLLLLLFPDGRLPSPRRRPAALVFLSSWGLLLLYTLFEPPTGTWYGGIPHNNPLAIAALGHPAWRAVMEEVPAVAVAGLAVVALAPLQRCRRAGPVQRQQLKWRRRGR
jgi:hypothetical protein